MIEHFWIAFSRHWRPFQALNCPIGVPLDITTPQRSHSESLRSSFEGRISRSEKISVVRIAGLWSVQHCVDTLLWKGGIYRAQVSLWYNADVGDSLNSHKSTSLSFWNAIGVQLERRYDPKCAVKPGCERRAKARGENFGLRLRKLRKRPTLGSLRLRK